MLLSIIISWFFGLQVDKYRDDKSKARLIIALDVIFNLIVIFIFKYLMFTVENINFILGSNALKVPQIALPIGISFFTFQAMSYVIDIYRKDGKAQKNILNVGLYIAFFPQLIAGPIVRYQTVSEQIEDRKETLDDFTEGVVRFVIGFSKKVLIANNMAVLADEAFATAGENSLLFAWIGSFAYTFQIYFDFSGYSDMAIGLGRLLGFTFSENFDHPYTAVSVTDFWRRWHISLSSWFREYVYIPLGGNRVSTGRHIRNLLIVWMLTGLWHGASLNFILWGLYYGIWLILEKYVLGDFLRKHRIAGRIYTLMIVVLGWMLFAITDFKALGMYLRAMFGMGAGAADHRSFAYLMSYGIVLLAGAVCSAGWPGKQLGTLCRKHERVLAGILAAAFVLCLASLAYDSFNPFLYFRF